MDIQLTKQTIPYLTCACRTSVVREASVEIVVPDTLPDVLEIADCSGSVLLRGKEAETGRVTVNGLVLADVLYTPEGADDLCRIEAELPFACSMENAAISGDEALTAELQLLSAEARILNSRKLLLRAEVCVRAACYAQSNMELASAAEAPDGMQLEILSAETEVMTAVCVREKTFLISEEFRLPEEKPPVEEILASQVFLQEEETKSVGSKLVLRGTAEIRLLYRTSRSGEPETAEFMCPFSQILELDEEDTAAYKIHLALTGKYVSAVLQEEADETALRMELQVVAQCAAYRPMLLRPIDDLYSTRYELDCVRREITLPVWPTQRRATETARGVIACMERVRRIVQTQAVCGPVQIADGEAKSVVLARVLYLRENGTLASVSGRLEAGTHCPDCDGAECRVEEVETAVTAEGFSVRVTVRFVTEEATVSVFSALESVSCQSDAPVDTAALPSVTLCRVQTGDTLWKLGKQFHTTPELILAANKLEDARVLPVGRLLLIPKKR